jgi:hypothetical protein
MSEPKKDSKTGCIVIAILLGLSWGIPSLIGGHGFFNGIHENILAAIKLGAIFLIGYGLFEIFKN